MIIVFLLVVAITDALRDRWVYRVPDVSWWQWHLVKWVSFFLASGYVFFDQKFTSGEGAVVILLCFFAWNAVYWYRRK